MNKFFVTLAALLFTAPAFASLDHWTCSNDQTVMFMVLNTDDGSFHLWDDKGQFLVAAKFTDTGKTENGTTFYAAQLNNGAAIGIAKQGNSLILAIANDANPKAARLICN